MTSLRLAVFVALAAVLAGCPRSRIPKITELRAEPDSVTRSGVARLFCSAEDPDGGAVVIEWRARLGEVRPDTGRSPLYIAPSMNVVDTVSVTVTSESGRAAESLLVITVAEGLCGGRPRFLTATAAVLLAADSQRVYFAESTDGGYVVRWWCGGCVGDSGVVATRAGVARALAYHRGRVWVLERDPAGPGTRIVGLDWTGGAADTVFESSRAGFEIAALAVSDDGTFFSWAERGGDTVMSGVSMVPAGGGAMETLFSIAGVAPNNRVVGRVAAAPGVVVFAVAAPTTDSCEIRKLTLATRQSEPLVPGGFIAPGRLSERDGLVIVGSSVYWAEAGPGRLGYVGLDGSGRRYVLEGGGPADGIELLTGAEGPAGSGARVFWSVPGDLRALVAPSGDVLVDLDRGSGQVLALAASSDAVYFSYSYGAESGLYHLTMP